MHEERPIGEGGAAEEIPLVRRPIAIGAAVLVLLVAGGVIALLVSGDAGPAQLDEPQASEVLEAESSLAAHCDPAAGEEPPVPPPQAVDTLARYLESSPDAVYHEGRTVRNAGVAWADRLEECDPDLAPALRQAVDDL